MTKVAIKSTRTGVDVHRIDCRDIAQDIANDVDGTYTAKGETREDIVMDVWGNFIDEPSDVEYYTEVTRFLPCNTI